MLFVSYKDQNGILLCVLLESASIIHRWKNIVIAECPDSC
jgi:hypothetical protein